MAGLSQLINTSAFLTTFLTSLHTLKPSLPRLPAEVQQHIIDLVFLDQNGTGNAQNAIPPPPRNLPAIPPANGSSPFMNLSTELRRSMFVDSLPPSTKAYHPNCKDGPDDRVNSKSDPCPRRNNTSDLMTLNKKICGEITEMLYEERTFVIHVHEGLRDGGIEFQNTGRQPLQYKDNLDDARFFKFGQDDQFGFNRLKKIVIQIYPSLEENNRHVAINTFFMHLALCRLLERSGGAKNRITELGIEFVWPKKQNKRRVAARNQNYLLDHYWWDHFKKQPLATSIHNLSNVELVLRPFATLTGCHKVWVKLPNAMQTHRPTVAFVEALTKSMMSRDGTLFMEDDLERKIETSRAAMEDYVFSTLHGTGHREVSKLSAEDMEDDDMTDEGDEAPPGKENESPTEGKWKGTATGRFTSKTPSSHQGSGNDEDEEDRGLQAAIAASLAQSSLHAKRKSPDTSFTSVKRERNDVHGRYTTGTGSPPEFLDFGWNAYSTLSTWPGLAEAASHPSNAVGFPGMPPRSKERKVVDFTQEEGEGSYHLRFRYRTPSPARYRTPSPVLAVFNPTAEVVDLTGDSEGDKNAMDVESSDASPASDEHDTSFHTTLSSPMGKNLSLN